MSRDLASDKSYFEAIQASHAAKDARDRVYERLAAARNPLSRLVGRFAVKYRDVRYYDSEEHVGLIEELRSLDEAHGHTTE